MFASEFALEDIFAPSSASSTSSSVRQDLLSSRRRRRTPIPRTHAHARGHNKLAGEAEDADFLHASEDGYGYDECVREEDEDGGEEETSEGEEGQEDELLVQGSLQRAAFVHFM